MTDRIAVIVGTLLVCAILYDLVLNDATVLFQLSHKGLDLIEWLAFWR